MENTAKNKNFEVLQQPSVEHGGQKSYRPRKGTLLKLQWLAERLRKCERIRKEIEAGTYNVDSKEVAATMLGYYKDEE